MIEAEINPNDLRELRIAMKGLQPEELLKGELMPFAKGVSEKAGWYPPDFPGNTYMRTGLLGRSWVYGLIDSLSVEVANMAYYAGYVHGPEQYPVHRAHFWRRLYEVADDKIDEFIQKINDKIERIWNR